MELQYFCFQLPFLERKLNDKRRNCFNTLFFISSVLVQSPPRIVKQPPTDELLFQVKSRADENDKPFIIECEAEGEPAPM